MTRRRMMLLGVLALVLTGVVASWVRSYRAVDVVSYRWGTLRAPGEDAADPDMWSYEARSASVDHRRGQAGCVVSRYRSVGAARADMEGWVSQAGWYRASVPSSMVRMSTGWARWWQVRGWDDWNVLGVGVTKQSRQGESARAVTAPHWLMVVVLVGGMLWVGSGGRAARRRRRGWCPACGYDVMGGAACPECGWGRDAVAPGVVGGEGGSGA